MKTSALETVAFSVYLLLDISLGCKTQQTQIKSNYTLNRYKENSFSALLSYLFVHQVGG